VSVSFPSYPSPIVFEAFSSEVSCTLNLVERKPTYFLFSGSPPFFLSLDIDFSSFPQRNLSWRRPRALAPAGDSTPRSSPLLLVFVLVKPLLLTPCTPFSPTFSKQGTLGTRPLRLVTPLFFTISCPASLCQDPLIWALLLLAIRCT